MPVVEAPTKKRWALPMWATGLIVLATLLIVGGGIMAIINNDSKASSMDPTSVQSPSGTVLPTEAMATEEVIAEATQVSSPQEEVDVWRPLDFMWTNPQLWKTTEDNSYTALGPSERDAFTWSTETVEGDVAVSLDLERPESRTDACVIVYGGGYEFTDGSLIFCVDWNGYGLEKHTKYHEGENILVFSPWDNESDEVFSVTIEIIDDVASMYVDGQKVLSTIFDTEEVEGWGRIGLWKNWSVGDVIFSNIQIKVSDETDQGPPISVFEEFDCELDTGSMENYYPVQSPFISHSLIIDGEITSPEEWADAPCVDFRLHYGNDVTNPNFQRARWWIQNDGQDIFFLVRVSKELWVWGVFVNYWWPEYTGSWAHSDGVYAEIDGYILDHGLWDETQWREDKDLDPPGTVDLEANSTADGEFYWFEIRRALNSGDEYDWVWEPGQTYGANPRDFVMIGVEGEEGTFVRYIQLEVGEP
jgi:hypothetical protein